MKQKPQITPKLPNITVGINVSNWTVVKSLDEGGAGEVFLVKNEKNEEQILKKLKSNDRGKGERFDCEIKTLYDLKNNSGVINILDDYNSHNIEVKEKWYIVEKGIPLKDILMQKIIEHEEYPSFFIKWLFEKYIELLTTLNELNIQQIYHRDIKPENIIYINNRLVFIDFGVVRNENYETTNLTEQHDSKNLGAKFYMAPEMRRDPVSADHSKIDIYSITKTIWASLTGEYFSFDGQYNESHNWLRKIYQKFPNIVHDLIQLDLEKETISRISSMFYANTSDNPNERMTINETIKVLQNWITVFYKDGNPIISSFSQKDTDRRWNFAINHFFQRNIPKNYTWEGSTLNTVLFDIFEEDYFSVFLPDASISRLKVKTENNDLILENTSSNETTIFEIDYNWLFYREEEDFSYFYSKMKIKNRNDFIIITNDHIKGEYAKYYLNRRCSGFESLFDIESEKEYYDECKNYILKFKKHLIKGCPYCLSQFEEKHINFNSNSSIFKDVV